MSLILRKEIRLEWKETLKGIAKKSFSTLAERKGGKMGKKVQHLVLDPLVFFHSSALSYKGFFLLVSMDPIPSYTEMKTA